MASVDGSWDCVVKSPLGDQKLTLGIVSDGASFSGTASGAMGSSDVSGSVDGDTITWTQSVSVPMPMTLDCKATAAGDTLSGTVGAGAFGSFPLTGSRAK
ncbi:hypothetical protein [uncultured Sphingomonas sp.]|uniref:hypothetical protein n=1 Tax=uncultured Sphingomonas sp. TaxID=158754 RepID=UPI0035C9D31C